MPARPPVRRRPAGASVQQRATTRSRESSRSYEFDKEQEISFRSLAMLMRAFGILCGVILVALIFPTILWFIKGLWFPGLMGLFSLGILGGAAVWTFKGASSVQNIAETNGNDIALLMESIQTLSGLFTLFLLSALVAIGMGGLFFFLTFVTRTFNVLQLLPTI